MSSSIINGRDIVQRGFQKAYCDLCNRVTYWYKEAGKAPAHCTDHSNWHKGMRHADTSEASFMLANLSPKPEAPTEGELRRANMMLRNAETVTRKRPSLEGYDWAADLFPAMPVRDPNKLYCSFCGNPVDVVNVTLGRSKPLVRKTEQVYKDSTGGIHVHERVTVQVAEVQSCPNCIVQVRNPIVVRVV